ncbi:hypothetical protein SK128_023752 [Halocaridina rubra]|uniref:Uroporphyrinogen-III synthase n=1 Tax=Halocaridina rubra TaxID=373956 RepID=A0AAN8WIK7_HALRR
MSNTSVWLLKASEEGDDRYSDALSRSGFKPELVPTLTFKFINQTPLKTALENPQDLSGIIFTSPRAVNAVTQIYSTLNVNYHYQWSEKKIFAIGEATSAAIQKNLRLNSIGKESGNAQQLAPIIIKETVAFDKPLLYPCGNLGRDELPKLLASQDRDFRALTCYETTEHPNLKSTLQKLKDEQPAYIVFFSPSGVNITLAIFKALGFSLTNIKVIAIGPTTNTALVKEGVPVFGVCPSPSPEGLLHVCKSPL